jgi:hypothetical protein
MHFLVLPLLLLLASCAAPSEPAVPTLESGPRSTVTTAPAPVQESCREFTVPITVAGREEKAYGKACQQPDGTWQILPQAGGADGVRPNIPTQTTVIYPAYPYYDPWWGPPWWGPPWWGPFGFHRHHPYW